MKDHQQGIKIDQDQIDLLEEDDQRELLEVDLLLTDHLSIDHQHQNVHLALAVLVVHRFLDHQVDQLQDQAHEDLLEDLLLEVNGKKIIKGNTFRPNNIFRPNKKALRSKRFFKQQFFKQKKAMMYKTPWLETLD